VSSGCIARTTQGSICNARVAMKNTEVYQYNKVRPLYTAHILIRSFIAQVYNMNTES
jgi:hypothetical protein